jgi:DNA-binding NarL/FixJ family response regulator
MSGAANIKGMRVLIVEDEFFIADDLARAIRSSGGSPVGPVSTIREAEDMVRRSPVDAAIVDLNLRGEMASEFIRKLAATGRPCLIVSGYGEDAVPESVSAISRLEKPVSPAVVIETLSRELARA